jgi:VIT1/CCC1 family predicted Fe2+/Mn2+ transporter
MPIDDELREQLLTFQENEVTEHHIYQRLAERMSSAENRDILLKIAEDEHRHYEIWRQYTGEDVTPDAFKITWYDWISRLFGFTFGIRLMERGEEDAQEHYERLLGAVEETEQIIREEGEHEDTLIELLDEERLRYTGSVVLGLNDALVELTGALAGLTLALQDTTLIALSGSITGIAAALSMGASEYLSTKSEETTKNPVRASLYTGAAYLATVILLILPYLLLDNYYLCLAVTLTFAVTIIALFNYYISVAKQLPFRRRFLEMAGLSLGVAGFSFLVGYVIRAFLGVDV